MTSDSATISHSIDVTADEWIPLDPGQSFRPIAFLPDGHRQLLLRVEPGTVVPLHRHHGAVHAFTLSGARRLLDPAGAVDVAAGTYVYEPVGHVDSWEAIGDEPCVVHIAIQGAMDYLDDGGNVIASTDTAALQRRYLEWCDERGVQARPELARPL